MKKWMILFALFLAGCAAEPVYETIGDACGGEEAAAPMEIRLELPQGAVLAASGLDGRKSYTLGEWEIWTEVLPGGDIAATMASVTGLAPERLTVITRQVGAYTCHETVWSTAGEAGAMVGRAAVADDGVNHYCLAILSPEQQAGEAAEVFAQILESMELIGKES